MKNKILFFLIVGLFSSFNNTYAVVWPLQTTNAIIGRQCGSLTVTITANSHLENADGNYRITLYLYQWISPTEKEFVTSTTFLQYINYTQDILNKTFNGLSNGRYIVDMKVENLTSNQTEYKHISGGSYYSVGTGPSPGCTTWPTAGYAYNTVNSMNNCVSFYGNFGFNQAVHNMCYNQGLVDVYYTKEVCIPWPFGNRKLCITANWPVYSNIDVGKLLGYRFGNLPITQSSTYKYKSKLFIFCQGDYNTMTNYSPTITVTLPSGNGANADQDYSATCKSTAEVVSMNALPTAMGGSWSVVSPTGCGAYFENPKDPKSKFHAGTCNNNSYTLRWTDNSGCYDDMTVTYSFKCGFQDYVDGNSEHYPTVNLGGKCWLAKNLNFGIYEDLNDTTIYYEGGPPTVIKHCYKNNKDINHTCSSHGGLYTQHHAEKSCNPNYTPNTSCWHLSSEQDWRDLISDSRSNTYDELLESPPFGVLASGFNHKEFGAFADTHFYLGNPFWQPDNYSSIYWTSTRKVYNNNSTDYYHYFELAKVTKSIIQWNAHYKQNAYSVRCVRNSD